ncbi:hypothetical protein [Leptospira sp. GIMC2001]|uniref:hypothetical protein n=1 Tax=Leptospira sp. GIMC2001 TaxID=1513297 RepID=UPI00234A0E3A|nr:hypothetical protein [Leptospira sp. GIMC2001]WCL51167.1 hypothetical protein O4O04_10240 [Leptospira sp. GIMC2001]
MLDYPLLAHFDSKDITEIKFKYKNNDLIGKIVFRSARDVVVEMKSPYSNFQKGIHKPYFSDRRSNFLDDSGLECAVNQMKYLYDNLFDIFEKLSDLVLSLPNCLDSKNFHANEIEILNKRLKDAKRRLKFKQIDNSDYSKFRKSIHNQITNCEQRIRIASEEEAVFCAE